MTMQMQILNLIQGSAEWKEIRHKYCVASEAPVIMGASPHVKRDKLLLLKSSGLEQEFSEWVEEFIFKRGHESEALARPIAEEKLGFEDLYPLTGTRQVSGLNLLASFDGITAPDYAIHWEHKQFNQELFDLVKSGGELEGKHYWQLEHQLLVNGNDSCIFAVSDGTAKNYAELIYTSRPERRASLIEGWKIFLADLENYVAPEVTQRAIADPVATLPAITYKTEYNGKAIELKSNLDIYKAAAQKLVEQSKKKLETDQDFANAEARIKACKDAEERIAVIKDNAVGEVASIDLFVKDLAAIASMLRECRLNEDKQVKTRKETIRSELVRNSLNELNKFREETNLRFKSRVRLPEVQANLTDVIKGLKTIDSMRSKLNDEVTRVRIEINRIASIMDENILKLDSLTDKRFLFADLQQLITKDTEYFELMVKSRLKEHEDAEQARIQAEAKKIADEQIEADRKAKELEQLSRPVSGDNITVGDHKQFVADFQRQESGNLIGELAAEIANKKEHSVVMENLTSMRSGLSGAQFSVAELRTKTNYQIGMLDGLDLALAIFMKHGANGFAKAVEDFIQSDCIPESPKAAA